MRKNKVHLLITFGLLTCLTACGSAGKEKAVEETVESQKGTPVDTWIMTTATLDKGTKYESTYINELKKEEEQFIYTYKEHGIDTVRVYDKDGNILTADEKLDDVNYHRDFEYDENGLLCKSIEYMNPNEDMTEWESKDELDLNSGYDSDAYNWWTDPFSYLTIGEDYDKEGYLKKYGEYILETKEEGDLITFTRQYDDHASEEYECGEETYRIADEKLCPVHKVLKSAEGNIMKEWSYDDYGNLIAYDITNPEFGRKFSLTYLADGKKGNLPLHFEGVNLSGDTVEVEFRYDDNDKLIERETINYNKTKELVTYTYEEDRLIEMKTEVYNKGGKLTKKKLDSFSYEKVEVPNTLIEDLEYGDTGYHGFFKTDTSLKEMEYSVDYDGLMYSDEECGE